MTTLAHTHSDSLLRYAVAFGGGGIPLGAVSALSWCGEVSLGGIYIIISPIPVLFSGTRLRSAAAGPSSGCVRAVLVWGGVSRGYIYHHLTLSDPLLRYAVAFGGGGAVFGMAVATFVFSQAAIVLTDCWLARWSSLPSRLYIYTYIYI